MRLSVSLYSVVDIMNDMPFESGYGESKHGLRDRVEGTQSYDQYDLVAAGQNPRYLVK